MVNVKKKMVDVKNKIICGPEDRAMEITPMNS
jgi:hypothetical protein